MAILRPDVSPDDFAAALRAFAAAVGEEWVIIEVNATDEDIEAIAAYLAASAAASRHE